MAGFTVDYEHSTITITGKVEPKDGLLIAQYQQAGYTLEIKTPTKKDKAYYRRQLKSDEERKEFDKLCKAGKLKGWRDAVAYAKEHGAN